jgi:hypothetical protein
MAAPTVSYTWVVVDEISGHTWIERERTFKFDFTKNDRESIMTTHLINKFHMESRATAAQKTPYRRSSYILRTQFRVGKAPKVSVIANARLYREKNNDGAREEAQVHQLAESHDIGV